MPRATVLFRGLQVTPTQQRITLFMEEFLAEEDRLPNAPDLAKRFGWSDQNSAYDHIEALIRRGVLEKRGNKYRFMRKHHHLSTALTGAAKE